MINTGIKIFTIGGILSVIFGLISTMYMFSAATTNPTFSTVTTSYNWGMTFFVLAITIFIGTVLLGIPQLLKDK